MDRYQKFAEALIQTQPALNLKKDEPLAAYSTLQVGGPAKLVLISETSAHLREAVFLAQKYRISFVIIGMGSNVLFSDTGYSGLVIINRSKSWQILGDRQRKKTKSEQIPRFNLKDSGFSAQADSADNKTGKQVLVRSDSGVSVNYLMHALYKHGISGLEWFAGIPSTIGGAIYMNMHGGEHFFGDLLETAILMNGQEIKTVKQDYFKFRYDWSILHETKEIVLTADLRLTRDQVAQAKQLSDQWAKHKARQPRRSAGCIFQNLTLEEQQRLNLPSASTGYLIEHVLKLKGTRIGGAVISEKHAAFIENLNQAKAQDVFDLLQLIKEKAYRQLNLELKEEVQLIGKF